MPQSDPNPPHIEADPLAERSALRRASSSTLAAVAAASILLASICLVGWLTIANRDAADRNARTTAMIAASQRLMVAVTTAQSSARGYALTGDAGALVPYRQIFGNLDGFLGELRLTYREADRPDADIANVTRLVRVEIGHAQRIIAARRQGGQTAAADVVRAGEADATMDELRGAVTAQIDQAQSDVRAGVVAANNANWTQIFAALTALLAAAVLCLIACQGRCGNLTRSKARSGPGEDFPDEPEA